ncbi:hypothetical protein JB92DRAFT_3128291 [Gautieria morchelliformis]|nr:hypothetical protein JB92DRAFT_3128291 [Gautieria morchelliformis]
MQVSQPPRPTGTSQPSPQPTLFGQNHDYYPAHHQPKFVILRVRALRLLEEREARGLNSLPPTVKGSGAGPEAMCPTASFESIIVAAILGSPELRLTLPELFYIIPRRYTYYTDMPKHLVSLMTILTKSGRFQAKSPNAGRKMSKLLWSVVGHDPTPVVILPPIGKLCEALDWRPEQVPNFKLEDGRTIYTHGHR